MRITERLMLSLGIFQALFYLIENKILNSNDFEQQSGHDHSSKSDSWIFILKLPSWNYIIIFLIVSNIVIGAIYEGIRV